VAIEALDWAHLIEITERRALRSDLWKYGPRQRRGHRLVGWPCRHHHGKLEAALPKTRDYINQAPVAQGRASDDSGSERG
jgi:hypothetical protein